MAGGSPPNKSAQISCPTPMATTHSQKRPNAKEPDWLAKATELKQVALERLAAAPNSERDVAPTPGSWSASGIVEHLILVEECVAGLWQERLKAVPNAKAGFKSEMLSRMVGFVFSNSGIRVPTVAELEPVGGIGIEELTLRWTAARQRLTDTLPQDNQAAWVLHPALGPLSSTQMGRLITAHLNHHLRHWPKQIN